MSLRIKCYTNGETFEVKDKIEFLNWMKYESVPVPADK